MFDPLHAVDDARLAAALEPIPEAFEVRPGLRPAAVLAPICSVASPVSGGSPRDVDGLLFTQRPMAMRDHAGQIAFPGGRRDGTETPLQCALRESDEEVGIREGDIECVLGALPARVSNAGYLVHTVVARLRTGFVPQPDAHEVDRMLDAEFGALADPDRWSWREVTGVARPLPFFEFDARGALWGLTGRLTRDLLQRLGHTLPETPPPSPGGLR